MFGPVVLDVAGTTLTPEDVKRLRHPLVGMVILFARNYESASQLQELTAAIHAVRTPALPIVVDHEGGRVQRFRSAPFTHLPPMAELGRLWDDDVLLACRTAASCGYVLGAELRACGVDLTFAPVLDLAWDRSGVIGDRALHSDARTVAMLAAHLCHGLALSGMANCGKHFPGHGWAHADSHHAVPVDERSLDTIVAQDAAPYAWLAPMLAGVMPAHVVYPAVDRMPAGFSRRWIEDVLRARCGFTGAVFSDDLCMAGARVAGSVSEAGQAALAAGCDLVIVCNDASASDALLQSLQWSATAAFHERFARLLPRGEAPTFAQLQRQALYQQALRDVEQWRARLPSLRAS